MRIIKSSAAAFFLTALLFQSCVESSEKSSPEDSQAINEVDSTDQSSLINVSGAIFSIPSPVQTALLIESAGAEFDASLPNAIENAGNYVSAHDKGLLMGVYGADLAYHAIFDRNQEALSYLGTLEQLSADLDLGSAIDKALVKRFGANLGNRDSLLVLSSHFFRSSDAYLKENDRAELAALVIVGGWVEGMYLAYNSAESNPEIRARIAEQKHSLESIVALLGTVSENDQVTMLKEQIIALNDQFSGVTATYEFDRPETDAATKTTTLKSKTSYEISDELLREIGDALEAIRNSIVG